MKCNCYENYTCLDCEVKNEWTHVPEKIKLALLVLQDALNQDDFKKYSDALKKLSRLTARLDCKNYGIENIPLELSNLNRGVAIADDFEGIELNPPLPKGRRFPY